MTDYDTLFQNTLPITSPNYCNLAFFSRVSFNQDIIEQPNRTTDSLSGGGQPLLNF